MALFVELTLLESLSRLRRNYLALELICPLNGTAVLKGLSVQLLPYSQKTVYLPHELLIGLSAQMVF